MENIKNAKNIIHNEMNPHTVKTRKQIYSMQFAKK